MVGGMGHRSALVSHPYPFLQGDHWLREPCSWASPTLSLPSHSLDLARSAWGRGKQS